MHRWERRQLPVARAMTGKARWGPWVCSAIALALLLGSTRPTAHGEDPSEAEVRLGLTREDRRDVQRELTADGFEVGPIDGIFGRRTRAAIGNWQQANGLEVNGYLDARALARLITREAPVGKAKRERLRNADYAVRVAAAERLESSRQRSTALLAIVLEQAAAGDLEAARNTIPRIEDWKKRDRALERMRELESGAARGSGAAQTEAWPVRIRR